MSSPASETGARPRVGRPGRGGSRRGQRERRPLGFDELLLRAALLTDERALVAWHELRPLLGAGQTPNTAAPLLPTLRANLVSHGVEDDLLREFEHSQHATWAHNHALFGATMRHVGAVEAAGIPTMLLKGAALVASGKRSVGFRYMADVDVLVPTAQLNPTIDALLVLGFVPIDDTPVWYVRDAAPRFNASFAFVDPKHWQMDLHWHLLPVSCQPEADASFWNSAVAVELRGTRTRVLCPTDALLHAVLHGVMVPEPRSCRWVLDATLILSDAADSIDYDRLVEQAQMRRLTVALRSGLAYLRDIVDAPIPLSVIRRLSSRTPRFIERAELRASRTRPSEFRRRDRIVFYHQQCARRALPLRAHVGLLEQLKLARRCFGIKRVSDLRLVASGGSPGPGRPLARGSAAIDGQRTAAAGTPVTLGEPLELGIHAPIPSLFRYGVWVSEDDGVWLAGREAQLALALEAPVAGSLVLRLAVVNFYAYLGRPGRLEVALSGKPVGALTVHSSTAELADARFHLPAAVIAGRSLIELTLRTPDAASPAQLALNDNDRQVSLFLRTLTVDEPPPYELGTRLDFGEGGDGDQALAGGWGNAEPDGRWSDGSLATLVVRIGEEPMPLTLELEADPFLGSPTQRMRVDVLAGGVRIGRFVYDLGAAWQAGPRRATVPARCIHSCGELVITLRIRDARSPEGVEDDRKLGLFIRGLRLTAVTPNAQAASSPALAGRVGLGQHLNRG